MAATRARLYARDRAAPDQQKYSAPALSKGLDILELLAGHAKGLKKAEIAAALERSVSEIYRMLAVLEARGYLMLDADSERYALTMRLFELSHQHPPTKRLSVVAGEIMEEIAETLNQSVHLAILHGSDILVIAQVDSPGNNITSVRLGARVPITVTASGACLVHRLPVDRRTALYARNKDVSKDRLRQFDETVRQVIEHGICESPSPIVSGVHNISVPVFSYEGEVAAALTIPYVRRLIARKDPDLAECKSVLMEAGRRVSERVGAGAAGIAKPEAPRTEIGKES